MAKAKQASKPKAKEKDEGIALIDAVQIKRPKILSKRDKKK